MVSSLGSNDRKILPGIPPSPQQDSLSFVYTLSGSGNSIVYLYS